LSADRYGKKRVLENAPGDLRTTFGAGITFSLGVAQTLGPVPAGGDEPRGGLILPRVPPKCGRGAGTAKSRPSRRSVFSRQAGRLKFPTAAPTSAAAFVRLK
jgi:hypothetical protein